MTAKATGRIDSQTHTGTKAMAIPRGHWSPIISRNALQATTTETPPR